MFYDIIYSVSVYGEMMKMRFDSIAFTQDELDRLSADTEYTALCDNDFVIPTIDNRHYTALGKVNASIAMSESEAHKRNITFDGFKPRFSEEECTKENIPAAAFVKWNDMSLSLGGSFASSFATSYTSFAASYTSFGASYTSFHMHEYEYEFERGSFTSSYGASYMSSYGASYSSSYKGSYVSLYKDPYAHIINPFILVNGYGVNLI